MAYKILSLDGGGVWALLQVMALQQLYKEDASGHEVLKDFNLVAANCGGSITLAGLVMNKSLNNILRDFYSSKDGGKRLFAPRKWYHFWGRYSAEAKRQAVHRMLGDEWAKCPMSGLPGRIQAAEARPSPHFLICAYDCDRKRVEFFRSHRTSQAASLTAAEGDPPFAEAIHASTTGPSRYFDGPAHTKNGLFWDGAVVGLYNPVLAALTEAFANKVESPDIRILSIGAGTVQLPIWQDGCNEKVTRKKKNIDQEIQQLLTTVVDDPTDASTFVAHVMLRQVLPDPDHQPPVSGNIVRMSPVIRPSGDDKKKNWASPASFRDAEFHRLANLSRNTVDEKEVRLIKRYGKLWIEDHVPNQAIRVSRNFLCEIGHERFSKAKDAWQKLTHSV